MKVKRIIKQWRYPEASENYLARQTSELVGEIVKRLEANTKLMKFDATDSEVSQGESDASTFSDFLLMALIALLPTLARTVYRFNSKQWLLIASYYGGKDNDSVVLLKARGAEGKEEWYNKKYELWRSASEATIRKLTRDIVADWSATVRAESLKGTAEKEVTEILKARYKVYTSWANNRARGVVHSWNSILMRQRLDDAGVRFYIWRGVLDERERIQHVLWEGKRIGMSTNHVFPGEPYGCRCWAQPDFSKEEEVTE